MFDPKSMAAAIVGAKAEEPEAAEASTKELAAEDILAAFAENDPKALAAALQSFFSEAEATEPEAEEAKED